jgi:hypothetical protein
VRTVRAWSRPDLQWHTDLSISGATKERIARQGYRPAAPNLPLDYW